MESEELETENEDLAVKIGVEGNSAKQVMEVFHRLEDTVKEVM